MRASFFDALLFPEERHTRRPDPGPFRNYHSYKRHLRKEFRKKCVYCREADGLKGHEAFGVDHYDAKSRSEDPAIAGWENLFYACNVCNTFKGTSVSTPERFLPNPCDHVMAEHLQYWDADVETYTRDGAWLAELVRLSSRRDRRRFILSTLGLQLIARNELIGIIIALEARPGTAGSSDPDLVREYQKTVAELEEIDSFIERLTGEPVDSGGFAP
jgi:hypothetical protein